MGLRQPISFCVGFWGFACFLVLGFVFGLLFGSTAHAEFGFSPTVHYSQNKITDEVSGASTTSSDSVYQTLDFRIGYIAPATGLWLGGMYTMERATVSTNSEFSGSGYGPSVGFLRNGFNFIGTYVLSAERTYTNSGVTTKYRDGKGYQLDFGYYFLITQGFGLGPQFTYKTIKYSKTQVGAAAETSDTRDVTSLEPYLAFFFLF